MNNYNIQINKVDCETYETFLDIAVRQGYITRGKYANISPLYRKIFEKGLKQYVKDAEDKKIL